MIRVSAIAEKLSAGPVRALATTVLILLLGACVASRETYQTQLDDWVGKTKVELVEQFGPPQRSEKAEEGKEILIWSSASKMSQGTSAPIGGGFSLGLGMQSAHTCELSFTLVGGIAQSFEWKANIHSLFGKFEQPWHSGECGSAFSAKPEE